MDLGSLNIDGFENIINSLSQKDIEELKGLADSLLSCNDSNKKESQSHNNTGQDTFNLDGETIRKISIIMQKLSCQRDDPRCDLLRALKPMLSPQKQKKADEAINMLRVLSLLPIIEELKG